MKAFCELSEEGNRIAVHFRYDPEAVKAVKTVSGYRFIPKDKGGPYWTVPLDLISAQRLREAFGRNLVLGDAIRAWGREEVQKQRNLASLTRASDAKLKNLPDVHPDLFKFISARPYQRADIAMMAATNVLNANQPGTGKTIETIGSWIESGLWDQGPHLVIAPVKSLVNVWEEELEWLGLPVFTGEDPRERTAAVEDALECIKEEPSLVIAVNPDFIRLQMIWNAKKDGDKPPPKKYAKKDHKGNIYGYRSELQERLLKTNFMTCTIDEFHKMGLSNRNSLLSHSMSLIASNKKAALSGTPMGGRPRKLWAILNWLEPDSYTSEWRWIDQWLEVEEGWGGSKIVGGIQPGREDAFYEAHAKHIVRRLKRDALPGLPPQVHVTVHCSMTSGQRKQYEEFAAEAEIRINEERLSATNVLSEYTRLKQFANAKQELKKGVPFPTADSGKLEMLLEKLDEEGIRKDDPEPGARAIVASESARMVNRTALFLEERGIEVGVLTGDTRDTKSIIKRFKSKKDTPYVIVMTIQTGGISLNLEEADSMHALDETWNPDDMEQFFDRGDRGSRTTPLRCYTYRTKGTIQDYIAEVAASKKVTNKNILDIRRQMFEEAD